MKVKFIVCVFLAFGGIFTNVYSQVIYKVNNQNIFYEDASIFNKLPTEDITVHAYPPESKVVIIWNELISSNILSYSDFVNAISIKQADVNNFCAAYTNDSNFIFYDHDFFSQFEHTGVNIDFLIKFSLAHELGHFVNHDIERHIKSEQSERAADRFACGILYNMPNVSRDSIKDAIMAFAGAIKDSVYPSKGDRIKSVDVFYEKNHIGAGLMPGKKKIVHSDSNEYIQQQLAIADEKFNEGNYSEAGTIYYRFRLYSLFTHRQQSHLGYMYLHGYGGFIQDDVDAFDCFSKSADAGDADGESNLGSMYADGKGGVSKDESEAVKWYRKSADQNNSYGESNLGYMYEAGKGGLSKDDAVAAKWYQKSADQGNEIGQYNLGFIYENGKGLPQNLPVAEHWYRKAAAQGNEDAQSACRRLGVSWAQVNK